MQVAAGGADPTLATTNDVKIAEQIDLELDRARVRAICTRAQGTITISKLVAQRDKRVNRVSGEVAATAGSFVGIQAVEE